LLSVPQRDLLVNFERMWREIDELVGSSDPWRRARRQGGFSPRVDVYYCGDPSNEPKAIAKVELPGVDVDSVNLEVVGRELVISGERPVQETEGRVYQQVEIQTGPFRRIVPLGADVVAEEARASYEDGVLRVELPLRREDVTHTVPIEPRDE
jgi:HSP20 family protein